MAGIEHSGSIARLRFMRCFVIDHDHRACAPALSYKSRRYTFFDEKCLGAKPKHFLVKLWPLHCHFRIRPRRARLCASVSGDKSQREENAMERLKHARSRRLCVCVCHLCHMWEFVLSTRHGFALRLWRLCACVFVVYYLMCVFVVVVLGACVFVLHVLRPRLTSGIPIRIRRSQTQTHTHRDTNTHPISGNTNSLFVRLSERTLCCYYNALNIVLGRGMAAAGDKLNEFQTRFRLCHGFINNIKHTHTNTSVQCISFMVTCFFIFKYCTRFFSINFSLSLCATLIADLLLALRCCVFLFVAC